MRKGIYHLVKQIVVLFYYLMCNLCPVKQNRIVFDSSLGKSYSGNPKHIYEYLMANGYDLNWDCIWFYENEKYNIPGDEQTGPLWAYALSVLHGDGESLGV